MPLLDIVIADPVWSTSPEGRRHEWRLAIQEILEEHRFDHAEPESLTIEAHPELLRTRWSVRGGAELLVEVSRRMMAHHLDEYTDICRRMGALDQGPASAQLEALDMAKRVAHDGAARTVQRLFKPLGPDHRTARRLFTLVLTLFVDTSRMTMLHAHRPYRPNKGDV